MTSWATFIWIYLEAPPLWSHPLAGAPGENQTKRRNVEQGSEEKNKTTIKKKKSNKSKATQRIWIQLTGPVKKRVVFSFFPFFFSRSKPFSCVTVEKQYPQNDFIWPDLETRGDGGARGWKSAGAPLEWNKGKRANDEIVSFDAASYDLRGITRVGVFMYFFFSFFSWNRQMIKIAAD